MDIEYVKHTYGYGEVWYALGRADTDAYVETLRQGHQISQPAVEHLRRRCCDDRLGLRLADIGANLGTVALPAAACFGARVLAVEALPANVSLLTAAIVKNGLVGTVIPVHLAAHDIIDVVHVGGFSAWGCVSKVRDTGTATPSAPIVDILQFHNFLPDLVKIDVEGAELSALNRIEEVCDQNPSVEFVFEVNSLTCGEMGYFGQDLCRRFEELGFHIFAWRRDGVLTPITSADPHIDVCFDALATRRDAQYLQRSLGYEISHFDLQELLRTYETLARGEDYMKNHVLRNARFLPSAVQNSCAGRALVSAANSTAN